MAKTKPSTGYTIVGQTSDGVKILKPKMTSPRLRELQRTAKKVMAESRKIRSKAAAKKAVHN